MKRRLGILIMLFLLIGTYGAFQVHATGNIYYNDAQTVSYEVLSTSETSINGFGTYIHETGKTVRNSTSYNQSVNVLTMDTSDTSKVVTWAIPAETNDGFIRRPVVDIAHDYEERHPGWTVVGGINADQYSTKYGQSLSAEGSDYFYPQPYYPMITDYEKWFSVPVLPYGAGNIVGFLNDGSVDQLAYYRTTWGYTGANKAPISGLYLTIFASNGSIQAKYPISGYNTVPGANESSLYTPYFTGTQRPALEVIGSNVFIVENADLAFASNSSTYTYKGTQGQNAFFGKGFVTEIATNKTLNSGDFAISTNDTTLIAALSVGSYIKVQFEFTNDLNNVEAGIGFHTVMRNDGVDNPSEAAYNTRAYPRSIFGRTSDGTIVLMSIDGSNSAPTTGATQTESHAILKRFDVAEAYQMDGGGSVTMVARQNGEIITVNDPAEGDARFVLSALLFVVKDIPVETEAVLGVNQITLNIHILDQTLGTLYIRMNDETKEVIAGSVTFTGLASNTPYTYEYIYQDGEELKTALKIETAQTIKQSPTVEKCNAYFYEGTLYFEFNFFDPDGAITRKSVAFGDEIILLSKKQVSVTDITQFTFQDLVVSLSYDLNDGQGRQDVNITEFFIQSYPTVVLESIKNSMKNTMSQFFK
ncbi:MAG: phosphodiester glycosidase family protein [Bacilli bacterium]|nr:phosphodiester glycosidase family protein [Bacilli bacterium]